MGEARWPEAEVTQCRVGPHGGPSVTVRLCADPEVYLVELFDEDTPESHAQEVALRHAREWVYEWPRIGAIARFEGKEGRIVAIDRNRIRTLVDGLGWMDARYLVDVAFPDGPPRSS